MQPYQYSGRRIRGLSYCETAIFVIQIHGGLAAKDVIVKQKFASHALIHLNSHSTPSPSMLLVKYFLFLLKYR